MLHKPLQMLLYKYKSHHIPFLVKSRYIDFTVSSLPLAFVSANVKSNAVTPFVLSKNPTISSISAFGLVANDTENSCFKLFIPFAIL